jgi:hypothetical protein
MPRIFAESKLCVKRSVNQVEAFVVHLADWAEKDRNALLCQLKSYFPTKEGAA